MFWNNLKFFFGREGVNSFIQGKSVKNSLVSYSASFFLVSFILGVEAIIFAIIFGLVSPMPMDNVPIFVIVSGIGFWIVAFLVFVFRLLVHGSIAFLEFFLAKVLFRKEKSLKSYLGVFFALESSVVLVTGFLLLFPVIGWFLALMVCLYFLYLNQKIGQEFFRLNKYQSIIIVLLPVNFALLLLLILSLVASFLLVGSHFSL